MGVLNRLFGSMEKVAQDEVIDEEIIRKQWEAYLATMHTKERVIGYLESDWKNAQERKKLLQNLKQLLDLELVEIKTDEKEAIELMLNLEHLSHDEIISKIRELEDKVAHMESRFQHVYELLRHIYSALKKENQLFQELKSASRFEVASKLIKLFQNQIEIENMVQGQIDPMQTFHSIFLALARGEHVNVTMDAKKRIMLRPMQEMMNKIFAGEVSTGVIRGWSSIVYNLIQLRTYRLIMDEVLEGHQDANYEFVNRPEFIPYVAKVIRRLRKRPVSDDMIAVFVRSFRDWYNYK